jgi:hypothetical protein
VPKELKVRVKELKEPQDHKVLRGLKELKVVFKGLKELKAL